MNCLHHLELENTQVGDANLAGGEMSLTFIPVLFTLMDRKRIVVWVFYLALRVGWRGSILSDEKGESEEQSFPESVSFRDYALS